MALAHRNQNYSESRAQSGSLFRSIVSQQRWTEMAKQVREPARRRDFQESIERYHHQNFAPSSDGDYVVLRFQTSFHAKSQAIETLTVVLEDGQWKAVRYYIK